MTLGDFEKAVAAAGVLAESDIEAVWAAIPADARPRSAQDAAKLLVEQGKLTPFQAKELLAATGTPLVLGEYVLLAKIGAGGMGQVFKAQHKRMKRLVAIKLLPQTLTKDADSIRRFGREVEAAAKLAHPNIVSAYDAGECRGVHYLAMEYVDGRDLAQVARAAGKLTVRQVTDYILQAARGLAYAHGKGVIHRDIKPGNLLLDKEGTVKILDMGLARFDVAEPRGTPGEGGLTESGQVMGTADYMAPEQAFDTHRADARSDIYSLGCSMFRLLTSKNLYDGDTFVQKVLAHREKPIPDLTKLRPDVSQELNSVFKKMVAKNPEDRYQQVTEVISALEEVRNPGATATFSNSAAALARRGGSVGPMVPGNVGVDDLNEPIEQGTSTVPTASKSGSDVETDFKRERRMGGRGGSRPGKLLAAGGAGALLIVLLAVWVVVRDKSGKEVGRIELPVGGSVETVADTPPGSNRSGSSSAKVTAEMLAKPAGASSTKAKKLWEEPAFKDWMKSVAELSAQEQVDAVSKKLVELNPEFDGVMSTSGPFGNDTRIENGVVTQIGFHTDKVTDISPVRALPKLRTLYCNGSVHSQGQLADLSPLEDTVLKEIRCERNPIRDLTGIKGLQLTYLHCGVTKLNDLSQLAGMPLSYLNVSSSYVKDLAPLRGMPLKIINIVRTQVTDLSPLEGMPLEILFCYSTDVADLSPLRSMRLKQLYFSPNKINTGIEAIREMKSIEKIGIGYDKVLTPSEFWKKYDAGDFN